MKVIMQSLRSAKDQQKWMRIRKEEIRKEKKRSFKKIRNYRNNNKIEPNRNRRRTNNCQRKLQRKEKNQVLNLKEKLWKVEDRWKFALLSILHNLWIHISSKPKLVLMEVFKQSKKKLEEMRNGRQLVIRILRNSKHQEININITHSHKIIRIFRISQKNQVVMVVLTLLKMLEEESNKCLIETS